MSKAPVTIITPCYNEGTTVINFLQALEKAVVSLSRSFCVVVVYDGSTDNTSSLLQEFQFSHENVRLKVVDLKFNVGHQAAIYQGLLYVRDLQSDYFIIMDSDGEDAPSLIPELMSRMHADIVNVVRSSRKESVAFKLCYRIYKASFRMITGKQMNYGNFCLISRPVLELAVASNFSHFAAFLSKQECAKEYIVAGKELRIGGKSKMSFIKHFNHAVKSFVEYGAGWNPPKHVQNPVIKTPIYEINHDRNTKVSV